ncbi:uncharacterized protein LY89DRAFT_324853 [Mollisia scopiformis]|uniref:Uncharacterized protein n=1 Tax=Mollisia scopiformis TaxID=149040 RepID=A0A132BA08_MOLSC|nr:uncharacterized protein LY89DRAFT_324853 [Mollisia scopiformis]KUJ08704.1 hypothetical protein LY89DRAFT_324853 [Mollisia scopiformis]
MTLHICVRILPRASCARQSSFHVQQCRSICLMTETFGKKSPASSSLIHKLVPFEKYTAPDKCIIDLHYAPPKKGNSRQPQRMSLKSAMDFNINPGWLLVLKQSTEFNERPQYKMEPVTTIELQTTALENAGKGSQGSRIFRLGAKTSQDAFRKLMDLMWHYLCRRQLVEVQVQYHRNEYERNKKQDLDPFEKMFDENLHWRADIILKAMPPGCGMVVDPQTDNETVVAWIMGPPYVDKQGRVYPPNNKTKVLYERRDKAIERKLILEKKSSNRLEKLHVAGSEEGTPALEVGIMGGKADENAVNWQSLKIETALSRRQLETALEKRRTYRKQIEGQLLRRAELREMRKLQRQTEQSGQ